MSEKPVILLFEDTEDNANRLQEYLRAVSGRFNVQIFSAQDLDSDDSFVERLGAELKHYERILLIVSDMDLSKTNRFKGLTDAVVFRVAHELGIPTAFYSTALEGAEGRRLDQAGDGRILLGSNNYEQIAHRIAVLADGFQAINQSMLEIASSPVSDRPKTGASLVARLIGRDSTTDRIDLYLSGDQRIAAEILSSPKDSILARQSTIFGTWIYDSLMRYPGVLLNSVSAASYLNVSLDDFSKAEILAVFDPARYDGPFTDFEAPLYWREVLDGMLAENDAEDGLELLSHRGINASRCQCSVDPTLDAGYYCMVNEAPVSYEKSIGNISTFPPGADLARLSEPVFDELSPWLSV